MIGGFDTPLKRTYISKIIPDSPADKDGRLKPGDQVIKINNCPMDLATHSDAMEALRLSSSSSFIHLTVYRDPTSHKALVEGYGGREGVWRGGRGREVEWGLSCVNHVTNVLLSTYSEQF